MFRAFAWLAMDRSCDRSIIALRSAAPLCRAHLPKIIRERQLPDLGVERFDIDCRCTRLRLGGRPEHPGSPFEQQRLPGRDLVRMNVELLRQFGQRLLALDGGQSHLRLESRAVIPARSSRHRLSCSRAILAAVRQKLHLSTCPNLPSQLSLAGVEAMAMLTKGQVRAVPANDM